VEELPMVKLPLFCVAKVPSAVRYIELPDSPEDTDAVGVPPFPKLSTANFALVVACEPTRRSRVPLRGTIAPFNAWKGEGAPVVHPVHPPVILSVWNVPFLEESMTVVPPICRLPLTTLNESP